MVTAAVLTALSALLALRLPLESNLIALLPDDTPTIVALGHVLEKTSGAGDLMVLVESPDLDASKQYAESLLARVRTRDWLAQGGYSRDTSFHEKHQAYYMKLADLVEIRDRIKKRQQYENRQKLIGDLGLGGDEEPPAVDFSDIEARYRGKSQQGRYFTDPDGKVLLIVLYPSGVTNDLGFARRVFEDLQQIVDTSEPGTFHPAMKVSVGGTFRNRIEEFKVITADVTSSAIWVGVGLFLLIALYYRSVWSIPIIAVPLGMSIAWTFGFTWLTVGRLNIITVFLIVVLMGLGIDFGIHLLTRFQSERRRGHDIVTCLTETLATAGRAALTAAMTTAVAFLVLAFSDFRGLSEFGIIAGAGLVLSSLAFLLVAPAMLSWIHEYGIMPPRPETSGGVPGKPMPKARLVLGACLAVTAAALVIAPRAGFEYDLRNIRSQIASRTEFNEKMRLVFPKARDPALLIVEDADEAARVAAELESRRGQLGGRSLIEEIRTINDLLPRDLAEKTEVIMDLRERVEVSLPDLDPEQRDKAAQFLEKLQAPPPKGFSEIPAEIVRPFIGRPEIPGQLMYIFQSDSLMDLRNAERFAKAVGDIEVDGKHFRPASEPLVFADLWRVLKGDVPLTLAGAFLILTLLLWADLRSVKAMLLVYVPLLAGVLWMMAAMALVPIKLNVLNVAVLASVLGLGIDGGVHIYHRFKELGAAHMTRILRETGGAVMAATGTSMIGFGGMLSAEHPGLRSMGTLAVVGLGACLLTALLFLPALLAVLGKRAE